MATVPLVQRRTVNSKWYTTICLLEVFGEIRKTNKQRRIILHQDNASSHTFRQTTEYLSTQGIELMGHPPYSHDLVLNDCLLFPHIKNKLRGQWTPIFVARRSRWCVKKPCFGDFSSGMEKML